MPVIKSIETFYKTRSLPASPVLLALSGGPDSVALFYGLIDCSIPFHVAHVDHGWRQESKTEAAELQKLSALHKIPFHLKTLDPSTLKGNLEMACRLERYRFFSDLCNTHGLQGVFVGHHRDDQAETVLKRVLEGASWSRLSGLRAESIVEGVVVYRPFLNIFKKDLLHYLESKGVKAFEDSTNVNERFLRARMRQTLFPWLNQQFGKEIQPALIRLGNEMDEIKQFFEMKLYPILSETVQGHFGKLLDLTDMMPGSAIETKFLVREFCKGLSYVQIEQAVEALMSGAANKVFGSLIVDRKRLFSLKNSTSKWTVEMTECDYEQQNVSDWKSVWIGRCEGWVRLGEYEVGNWMEEYENKRLIDKRWTNEKVPAFLRTLVPMICREGKIVHEFLSGRSSFTLKPGEKVLKITMQICN